MTRIVLRNQEISGWLSPLILRSSAGSEPLRVSGFWPPPAAEKIWLFRSKNNGFLKEKQHQIAIFFAPAAHQVAIFRGKLDMSAAGERKNNDIC